GRDRAGRHRVAGAREPRTPTPRTSSPDGCVGAGISRLQAGEDVKDAIAIHASGATCYVLRGPRAASRLRVQIAAAAPARGSTF
ncbi:hypothetical protein MXD61_10220, partial [Frankia sp. AgPm24]|uniref:hypothetical protein n=1 Tax=Frankia sp. AgPm24 TaxID=631128 RepID=UPI002010A492